MKDCQLHEKLQGDVSEMNTRQIEHGNRITVLETKFSDVSGAIKVFGTILAILSAMVEITLIATKFLK